MQCDLAPGRNPVAAGRTNCGRLAKPRAFRVGAIPLRKAGDLRRIGPPPGKEATVAFQQPVSRHVRAAGFGFWFLAGTLVAGKEFPPGKLTLAGFLALAWGRTALLRWNPSG